MSSLFLTFLYLLGHWEVETSRTSPWVASPCSCLPAVRRGFAVNKRLGHQRGGVIHGVMSSDVALCISARKIPLLITHEVSLSKPGTWQTPLFPICSSLFLRILLLKHVAVLCHNVFQGQQSRHGRMSVEGRLHWTAGCPSVTGPGPVYKWRSQ